MAPATMLAGTLVFLLFLGRFLLRLLGRLFGRFFLCSLLGFLGRFFLGNFLFRRLLLCRRLFGLRPAATARRDYRCGFCPWLRLRFRHFVFFTDHAGFFFFLFFFLEIFFQRFAIAATAVSVFIHFVVPAVEGRIIEAHVAS